jgi:hypothetical protein
VKLNYKNKHNSGSHGLVFSPGTNQMHTISYLALIALDSEELGFQVNP